MMHLHEFQENGVSIIALEGRLDGVTAPLLDAKIKSFFESGGPSLLFDFGQLDYLSSAGLRSILQAVKKSAAAAGRIAACGAGPSVREILEISGFSGILKLYPDRAAALREIAA